MYPFPPPSHAQLLDLAHEALEAAHDHDPGRVEAGALRLFEELTDHVLAERPAFLHLPPGDARLLEGGQQRIVDLLLSLAASAARNTDPCGCPRIAEDVVAELTLQAHDERRYLLNQS